MAESGNTAAASQAPQPDPQLERLEPLVGRWMAEDQTVEGPAGPAVKVTSTESFEWLDGGFFLVSTWVTVFGDTPAQKGVMYWGYDAGTERFRTHFFDKNGPFHEHQRNTGRLR